MNAKHRTVRAIKAARFSRVELYCWGALALGVASLWAAGFRSVRWPW